MKQLSSIITGLAWRGSRTPPIPAPPEIWQFFPTCAHEPTVAQVSTIVPSSTYAPKFIKQGINTALLATKADLLTTQFGTALKPAS